MKRENENPSKMKNTLKKRSYNEIFAIFWLESLDFLFELSTARFFKRFERNEQLKLI